MDNSAKITYTTCPVCNGQLLYVVRVLSYGTAIYEGGSMLKALDYIETQISRSTFDIFKVTDLCYCSSTSCKYNNVYRAFIYKPTTPEKGIRSVIYR